MKKTIFTFLFSCISLLVVAQAKLVALSPATTVKDGQSYLYSFSTNVPGASIVYGSLKVTAANLTIYSSQPSGSNDRLSIIYTNNNVTTSPKTGTLTFTAKYILNGNVTQEYTLPPLNISVTIQPPPPSVTPPINDEYSGAIILTPSNSATCVQQTVANFNNATITQKKYENLGYDGNASGNNLSSDFLGDIWYKFVPTNTTHEITVAAPPSGYSYRIEFLSLNGTTFKVIDIKSSMTGSVTSIKSSGLIIAQTYYVRLVLISNSTQNKNVSLNICITTPLIQSPEVNIKTRYEGSEGYIYDGNVLGLSFALPQNISESDLVFDWRLVNDAAPAVIDGAFLYEESGSPINNGTYSLLNVSGRRVKIGLGPKSPSSLSFFPEAPFWGFYVEVRIKQISTNTYLTDWIRKGEFYTEL